MKFLGGIFFNKCQLIGLLALSGLGYQQSTNALCLVWQGTLTEGEGSVGLASF